MEPNVIAGPSVAPAPGYEGPVTDADVLPAAYSPAIGCPAASSTRACSSVSSPPLVPISPASSFNA
jgi:hypothetical protein